MPVLRREEAVVRRFSDPEPSQGLSWIRPLTALLPPQNLKAAMAAERTKGFSHVVVTSNLRDGFSLLIQSAGLGGMKHNTVLMAWPAGWTQDRDPSSRRNFIGKNT